LAVRAWLIANGLGSYGCGTVAGPAQPQWSRPAGGRPGCPRRFLHPHPAGGPAGWVGAPPGAGQSATPCSRSASGWFPPPAPAPCSTSCCRAERRRLLPNRFPEGGAPPAGHHSHTADASLRFLAALEELCGGSGARWAALAGQARSGLPRFWNARAGCRFGLLDPPEGAPDPSLRAWTELTAQVAAAG